MDKLKKFVKDNYETLPKSSFNKIEVVIVKEICDEDYGYGNHSYQGIGIGENNKFYWCYSSGCSCEGSCEAEVTTKAFIIDKGFEDDLKELNPDKIDFDSLQVSMSDY